MRKVGVFALTVLLVSTSGATAHKKRQVRRASPLARAPAATIDPTSANEAFVSGDYQKAIQLYTTLLANGRLSAENRGSAFLNRGLSYLRLKRREEAIFDFRQALVLNPNDAEAATALFSLQNQATGLASGNAISGASLTKPVWGPLTRLPGKSWLLSTTKPVLHVRYEWARVGVSMNFAGKDLAGNRLEGQYFVDPASSTVRVNSSYRGKTTVTDLSVYPDQFVEITEKGKRRQVTQLLSDGTFTVFSQKLNGKEWYTLAISTLTLTTPEMVLSLGWPAEAPVKQSFWKGIGQSLKGGALEGFREGTRDGVHDAVQDRIRRATGTRTCKTISGDIVACP